MANRRVRARPAHEDPTQPLGVACPRCSAQPGRICTGPELTRFFHEGRKAIAAANARSEGAER